MLAISRFSSTVQWPIKQNLALCKYIYILYISGPYLFSAQTNRSPEKKAKTNGAKYEHALAGWRIFSSKMRVAIQMDPTQHCVCPCSSRLPSDNSPPSCSASNIYLWPAPTTARQTIFNLNNFARISWAPPTQLFSLSLSFVQLSCKSGWIVE